MVLLREIDQVLKKRRKRKIVFEGMTVVLVGFCSGKEEDKESETDFGDSQESSSHQDQKSLGIQNQI